MAIDFLRIDQLRVYFESVDGIVKAADGVDLRLESGKTLALVGETGSGKTILGLALIRLLPQTAVIGGDVWYKGENIFNLSEEEMRSLRGREIAMILQNPLSSLNPALTVGEQIAEVLQEHRGMRKIDAWKKASKILKLTGIPAKLSRNYAHEFSGGMRQRVMIAIGLACEPSLLIADEPTKGLDVTVQVHIVELLYAVTKGVSPARSMLLITHDLGVAAELADRMAVMYAGKIVEVGPTGEVFRNPRHPYTKGLLDSHPSKGLKVIGGLSPSLINVPPGCSFHPRCKKSRERCKSECPSVKKVGKGHEVRCHYA